MKNLAATISILLYSTLCIAQKSVTIDRESVPVTYYRIPDEPLDPSYTTYSPDIETRYGGLSSTGFSVSSLTDQYLTLSGYKRVNKDGDVLIVASIGDFNVYGERTVTRSTKHKDKNGKEVQTYTYAEEVRYSLPISMKVSDKKLKTLDDESIFSWSDERTYTTSYYSTTSELDSYWRSERISKLSELQREMVKDGFTKISEIINNKYGYRLMKENAHFEMLGKKKHPDYAKYAEAVETIKSAFRLMDANKGLEDIKTSVKPSLDFFNAEGSSVRGKSKDAMKLRHINFYNQALAWYWLEDFDQATAFVKELQKFDSKDKEAKKLLEEIDSTRASLAHANKTSRHGTMVGGKT